MGSLDSGPREITRPTFPWRKRGLVSYGLPFPELVATHVERLRARRVFALISGSLTKNTDSVSRLEKALASKLIAKQIGFPSHVPWDHLLALAKKM